MKDYWDFSYIVFIWWRIRDLNPGPTDYDSAALTTELIRHMRCITSKRQHFAPRGEACQGQEFYIGMVLYMIL